LWLIAEPQSLAASLRELVPSLLALLNSAATPLTEPT